MKSPSIKDPLAMLIRSSAAFIAAGILTENLEQGTSN